MLLHGDAVEASTSRQLPRFGAREFMRSTGGFVGNVTLHFTSKRSTVLNTFLVAMYFWGFPRLEPEKGSP